MREIHTDLQLSFEFTLYTQSPLAEQGALGGENGDLMYLGVGARCIRR